MKCPHCGADIEDNSKICTNCLKEIKTSYNDDSKKVGNSKKFKETLIIAVLIAFVCIGGYQVISSSKFKNLFRKSIYYNDLAHREKLYKENPSHYGDSSLQEIADSHFLSMTERGTQEPEPEIVIDDLNYKKTLGDGYFVVFDCEDKGDYISGISKIVNDKGEIVSTSGIEERGYFDDQGNIYRAEIIGENGIYFDYQYFENGSEGVPEVFMLGNNQYGYGIERSYKKYDEHDGNITIFKHERYYDSEGKLSSENIDTYTYFDGLLVEGEYQGGYGAKTSHEYSYPDEDHMVDVSEDYWELLSYKGFKIRDTYLNQKIDHLYDNSGLEILTKVCVDDVLDRSTYYVYDFATMKCYAYEPDYIYEYNMKLEISNIFYYKILSRIGFTTEYNVNSEEEIFKLSCLPYISLF